MEPLTLNEAKDKHCPFVRNQSNIVMITNCCVDKCMAWEVIRYESEKSSATGVCLLIDRTREL